MTSSKKEDRIMGSKKDIEKIVKKFMNVINSLITQMKEQNPDQNFGEIDYQMLRQKVEQQRRQKNMQKADMYKQYELEKQGKVLSSMEESNTSLLGGLLSKLGGRI